MDFQIKMRIFASCKMKLTGKMKFKHFLKLLVTLVIVVGAISCKKDKKEKALPALSGQIKFELPEFVEPGQTITIKVSGITHPEDKPIGYYIDIPILLKEEQRDTIKTLDSEEIRDFTFTFPRDTIGTYTIFAYAFAEGYQNSSNSKITTLVNSNLNSEFASIQYPGSKLSAGLNLVTKAMVGDEEKYYTEKYYTTTINGKEWLANNVHYPYLGKPFRNATPMTKVFGNYYNYEDANKVCPTGWRLPTETDYNDLFNFVQSQIETNDSYQAQTAVGALVADAKFNTNQMWEYWSLAQGGFGKITNETGLNIIPAGYCNLDDNKWEGSYQYATFWLKSDDESSKEAKVLYIYNYSNDVKFVKMDKESFGANVRCIKN